MKIAFTSLILAIIVNVEGIVRGAPEDAPIANGFDFPVGWPTGEGFYRARGFNPNVYPAEMWNGVKGGDTDLCEPVSSIADGTVVLAEGSEGNWGGVVLVRHRFRDAKGKVQTIDSFYAHVQNIGVRVGDRVARGQKIAEIGNAEGRLSAHLRFEIRKNPAIGADVKAFKMDYTNYHSPTRFIKGHRPPHRKKGG